MRWLSPVPMPSLSRQLLSFGLIGGVQVLLDWLVFVVLSAAGVPVLAANVGGRIAGASLGFWLNGAVTFRQGSKAMLGRGPLRRFALMWCGLTVLSSTAMALLAATAGLHFAWLAKPVVELVLAALSFVLARHWVYRH